MTKLLRLTKVCLEQACVQWLYPAVQYRGELVVVHGPLDCSCLG
jgi:hypothetical protein